MAEKPETKPETNKIGVAVSESAKKTHKASNKMNDKTNNKMTQKVNDNGSNPEEVLLGILTANRVAVSKCIKQAMRCWLEVSATFY